MRAELRRLRALAGVTADAEILAEINVLIRELERRLHRSADGADQAK